MSHDTPEESVMLQVPNVGAFVRALLPVRLTGGYQVTFGVWMAVHPDDLQRAFRIWWEPEYVDLVLDGVLANALPTWDVFGASLQAVVRNADHTPYVETTSHSALQRVLTDEWAHESVLSALPA